MGDIEGMPGETGCTQVPLLFDPCEMARHGTVSP